MRTLLVDTTLMQPPTGGCQTFLNSLAAGLVEQDWEVHVACERGPDASVADRLVNDGVQLHPDLWRPWHIPEERAARLAAWANEREINAYLVSVSADAGWVALPLLEARIITMAIVHLDWPAFYTPLTYYAPFLDRAVGVSRQTHRRIVQECGVPPERAARIPYGVKGLTQAEASARWENLPPPAAPLRLGYVGRLEQRQKRVKDIPLLATELARRGLRFELHLIGTGEAAPELSEEIARRGLSRVVRFWGWLSPDDVRRRLLELDVLLLFSKMEGLPLALLEAMSHAVVPVITRTDSGNPEVVRDDENGYLVPIGDVGAFADRLQILAADPSRLVRFRRAAWQTSRAYSVERTTSEYMACLRGADPMCAGATRAPRPPGVFPVMPSCRSSYPIWLRKLKGRVLGAGRGPSWRAPLGG